MCFPKLKPVSFASAECKTLRSLAAGTVRLINREAFHMGEEQGFREAALRACGARAALLLAGRPTLWADGDVCHWVMWFKVRPALVVSRSQYQRYCLRLAFGALRLTYLHMGFDAPKARSLPASPCKSRSVRYAQNEKRPRSMSRAFLLGAWQ